MRCSLTTEQEEKSIITVILEPDVTWGMYAVAEKEMLYFLK